MKIVFKIPVYLIGIMLNFLIYILVFSAAVGMKPTQGLDFVKHKIKSAQADSVAVAEQDTVRSEELKDEIEDARETIARERAELQGQKEQLAKEKEELEALKKELQQLLADKNEAEEERMYSLAKIYDGMDQENVARVFDQLDDSLVVAILPKMKPANASQVLEFLPAERSAKISKMLLKRGT